MLGLVGRLAFRVMVAFIDGVVKKYRPMKMACRAASHHLSGATSSTGEEIVRRGWRMLNML